MNNDIGTITINDTNYFREDLVDALVEELAVCRDAISILKENVNTLRKDGVNRYSYDKIREKQTRFFDIVKMADIKRSETDALIDINKNLKNLLVEM